ILELPAPKIISKYQEGFEHVEFVIDKPFNDFMTQYRYIKFETKGMNKSINPDIKIKYNNLSVKFHHHNLEYVIKYLD
ncbi:MAG: VOC family protein, partial [Bacteroidota bacterium]